MSITALIQQQIREYEQELIIYSDCLSYAQNNNIYADIERYSHMIEFTHRKIATAEHKLHRLKVTG
jgi:hypothetical protein